MQKIKLGNFPFNVPQVWQDITPTKLKQLEGTKSNQIKQRVHILCELPDIELSADIYLAIYEMLSFIEEVPELVPNRLDLPPLLEWISSDWTFAEFEAARKIAANHLGELGVTLYALAQIKGLERNYLEAGCKALDGLNLFIEQWAQFDLDSDKNEPTDLEEMAGIDRLQAFGVYPILESVGAKYGKYPSEIETQPAGWVMQEYIYTIERQRYTDNLRKLQPTK